MSSFLYFAYGSNLLKARLQERTPSAFVLGTATLPGHRLAWHKRGQDGSAKCDVVGAYESDAQALVFGVLYRIDEEERSLLDEAEGLGNGYDAVQVTVWRGDVAQTAMTYKATSIDSSLHPYDWYKALVLAGALHHQFPAHYLRSIDSIEAKPDADPLRAARHWDIVLGSL